MSLNAANKEVIRLAPGQSGRYRLRNGRSLPLNVLSRNVGFSGDATWKVQSGGPLNEKQTITITGTSTAGTFTISYAGTASGPITYSATGSTLIANVTAAMAALATTLGFLTNPFVVSATSVGANSATIGITFVGPLAGKDIPLLACSVANLTGGSPAAAIAEVTKGTSLVNCTLTDLTPDGASGATVTVKPRGMAAKAYGVDSDSSQMVGPVLAFVNTGTVGDVELEVSFADDQVDIVKLPI